MKTYDVCVQRGTQFLIIYVPGIGKATQARNLGEIELMAKDLISLVTGEDTRDFAINVRYKRFDHLLD